MIRVVGGKEDEGPGPIDQEARELLERVLLKRPLVLGIVWEAGSNVDFVCVPPLESVAYGLAKIAGSLADKEAQGE